MIEQEKREKVIKGLECIRDWSQFAVNKGWLVAGASEKMVKYAEEALELLKAQEPKKKCADCGYAFTEGFVHERLVCEKHLEIEISDDWYCADFWEK